MGSLKVVFRRLLRAPAFTAVALMTLAVGIGANTAIFSVVNGVLLQPLPYPGADRLISMNHQAVGINVANLDSSPYLYFTEREQNETLEGVGLWRVGTASVTGYAAPEQVRTLTVTFEILPLLGAQPLLGRYFSELDDSPRSAPTIVLLHDYWQRRFGGDRSAIGSMLTVEGEAREIIGVMPPSFRFLDERADFIQPYRLDRSEVIAGAYFVGSIARMKPRVSLDQVSADVARMIPIAIDAFPSPPGNTRQDLLDAGLGPNLRPLKDEVVGDVGGTLWVLMGAIGIVLLIACANVANLMLVRADGRRHELLIRAALGAGPGRIARELLLESVALGVLGGVLGLALAYGGVELLLALAPANLPRLAEITIDPSVLAFALGVSLLSGLLFGLAPAVKHAAAEVASGLRAGGRGAVGSSRERQRARGTLVVVQLALAFVMLVSAGLMIRTFQALSDVDPGFVEPSEVLAFDVTIPPSMAAEPDGVVRMQNDILDRVTAVAGVASAAFGSSPPMGGETRRDVLVPEGRVFDAASRPEARRFKFVSPGFLGTSGTPLIAGRDLTWTDSYERRPVTLVSANLARLEWGGVTEAIGKRVRGGSSADDWREIVGVVGDVRDDGVTRPATEIVYLPALVDRIYGVPTLANRTVTFLARSPRAGASAFLEEVRNAVWSVSADLPLANVRTLGDMYERSLARTSLTLVMLAIAASMALLLGVVGIYGVIAYAVSQQTREIGIRMALGAQQRAVRRMFMRNGLALAAIGIAVGVVAATAVTQLMSSLLYGVSSVDPITYAAVCAVLLAAVMLASYLPARRATTIDPLEALRAE
jgi:predicted permease